MVIIEHGGPQTIPIYNNSYTFFLNIILVYKSSCLTITRISKYTYLGNYFKLGKQQILFLFNKQDTNNQSTKTNIRMKKTIFLLRLPGSGVDPASAAAGTHNNFVAYMPHSFPGPVAVSSLRLLKAFTASSETPLDILPAVRIGSFAPDWLMNLENTSSGLRPDTLYIPISSSTGLCEGIDSELVTTYPTLLSRFEVEYWNQLTNKPLEKDLYIWFDITYS